MSRVFQYQQYAFVPLVAVAATINSSAVSNAQVMLGKTIQYKVHSSPIATPQTVVPIAPPLVNQPVKPIIVNHHASAEVLLVPPPTFYTPLLANTLPRPRPAYHVSAEILFVPPSTYFTPSLTDPLQKINLKQHSSAEVVFVPSPIFYTPSLPTLVQRPRNIQYSSADVFYIQPLSLYTQPLTEQIQKIKQVQYTSVGIPFVPPSTFFTPSLVDPLQKVYLRQHESVGILFVPPPRFFNYSRVDPIVRNKLIEHIPTEILSVLPPTFFKVSPIDPLPRPRLLTHDPIKVLYPLPTLSPIVVSVSNDMQLPSIDFQYQRVSYVPIVSDSAIPTFIHQLWQDNAVRQRQIISDIVSPVVVTTQPQVPEISFSNLSHVYARKQLSQHLYPTFVSAPESIVSDLITSLMSSCDITLVYQQTTQYQTRAFVPLAGEVITVDKWFRELTTPQAVRKLGNAQSVLSPFTAEPITVDKWFQQGQVPLKQVVRQQDQRQLIFRIDNANLSWLQEISKPQIRVKRVDSIQSITNSYSVAVAETEIITVSVSNDIQLPDTYFQYQGLAYVPAIATTPSPVISGWQSQSVIPLVRKQPITFELVNGFNILQSALFDIGWIPPTNYPRPIFDFDLSRNIFIHGGGIIIPPPPGDRLFRCTRLLYSPITDKMLLVSTITDELGLKSIITKEIDLEGNLCG